MKFYLTKAAQRAAESGATVAKTPKAAKPEKVRLEKVRPEKVRAAKAPRAEKPARGSKAGTASVIAGQAGPSVPAYASAPSPTLVGTAPAAPAPVAHPASAPVAPLTAAAPPALSATALLESPTLPEAPSRERGAKAPKSPAVKKQSSKIIAIGGEARVDLLPTEVRAERRAGVQVRRVWLGVAALVVVAGIATGAATLYAQQATSSLTQAQAQTSTLSAEAAKYSSVKTIQGQVSLIEAARAVGGATDIDWPAYLTRVENTLPSGMSLSTVTIDSASPVVAYAQASSPLQGQRVATLQFSASSSTLPAVTAWLNNLTKLPGFADAEPGQVSQAEGVYTSAVTLHINQAVFSKTYAKKAK